MKSVALRKYRTNMTVEERETRELIENEVRVKTAYAGINFTDRIIQLGLYKYQREHMPLPYTPGFEASGTVIEVGDSVTELNVGDTVVVIQRSGCLSSEMVANSENVIKLPDDIDMAWAASLPVNFFTASHALNNLVKIFPRSRVLIGSAAGGVGGMLTQLASKDHVVTGIVGREDKRNYVQKLGAHKVCTYKELQETEEKFDVIFTASSKHFSQYPKRLSKNGKIVLYGFHDLVPRNLKNISSALISYLKLPSFKPFELVYNNNTVSGFNIIHLDPSGHEFVAVKNNFIDLINRGEMPNKHSVHKYELNDINTALEDLASGEVKGKIVIRF